MSTTYGYIRVSTAEQHTDRQLIAMQEQNIAPRHIFIDKQSGKDFRRPAYRRLMRRLKPGDLLVVKSIDRLGRDYHEILEQWRVLCRERGVDVNVLDMPLLNTRASKDLLGTFISDLVLQLLSFVAENERHHIRQRQAEGIAAARLRGVHLGRPPIPEPEGFAEMLAGWQAGILGASELSALTGMSEATLYRKRKAFAALRDQQSGGHSSNTAADGA